MIDPTQLSMIRDVVAIFGVIAGFTYYALSVRNQNQARKVQLLLTLHKDLYDYEWWKRGAQIHWEWKDYDEFERKYGSETNPEAYAMRISEWLWSNNVGLMVENSLVDEDMCYDLYGSDFIMSWTRWEPIIKEQRIRYMGDNYMQYFETLADRMKQVQNKRNITWEPPETHFKYLPDTSTP